MRGSKELRRATIAYGILTLAILGITLFFCWSQLLMTTGQLWVILGIVFFACGIGYLILFVTLQHVFRRMKDLNEKMEHTIVSGMIDRTQCYSDDEMGQLEEHYVRLVDILQQSRQRELQEKEFLQDTISDISHQLKTPIASLTVFVDLLEQGKLDGKDQKTILNEASNQLGRMEWLVLSMLKLARIEAGAVVFQEQDVYASHVIQKAVQGVYRRAQEKEQHLEVLCDDKLVIRTDEDWLAEALSNLLKNAIDYTPQGGTITVQVEGGKGYTRIVVEDNGIGISRENLPHIFERFYRANSQVNPNSVGIGLALVKSIVEGMHGRIHVDSEEGHYTRFVLFF